MRTQTFDRDDVVAAGLRVVRRHGWAGLSVRAVATELGVTPMALYRVFSRAEQLRAAVADEAARPLTPQALDDVTASLRAWAHDAHRHLRALPGVAAHVTATWTELPGWLDVFEGLLGMCSRDGTDGADDVATANAVFAYVLARVQLAETASQRKRRLRHLRQDPGRYPLMAANMSEFAACEIDRHFSIGLDALLVGLHARRSVAR